MDRAIYGDNQFFGVNHLSEKRASERAARFQSDKAIYETLCDAHEVGVRTFMFTTHARLENVFDLVRRDPRFADFKLMPCLPYAHKYADAMTDAGVVGALWRYLPRDIATLSVRALRGLLTLDPAPVLKSLVDAELRLYRGMNVEAIFLQNIAVDFAVGLGMDHLLEEFSDYVEQKYGVRAGFLTMNHVVLDTTLKKKIGLRRPLICSPINAIGFRMNPTRKAVEERIADGESDVIAMSVLASGALPPDEALTYVNDLQGVNSIVFGASSQEHIEQTYRLITEPPPK